MSPNELRRFVAVPNCLQRIGDLHVSFENQTNPSTLKVSQPSPFCQGTVYLCNDLHPCDKFFVNIIYYHKKCICKKYLMLDILKLKKRITKERRGEGAFDENGLNLNFSPMFLEEIMDDQRYRVAIDIGWPFLMIISYWRINYVRN